MECAIVGATVGGQVELVTEQCGKLIDRESFDQEKDAYLEALQSYLADPQALQAAGSAARERILSSFQIKDMIAQMKTHLTPSSAQSNSSNAASASIEDIDLLRNCMECCEQARLEDEAKELWLDNQRLYKKTAEQNAKLENFRGMIARRNEKIERLGKGKKRLLSWNKGKK